MPESPGPMTGAVIGRYRIDALLGSGGMGDVYRAHDTMLGRAVALKILPAHLVPDPDRLARFVQEARAASALNHPHVVTIYEVGQAPQPPAAAAIDRAVHFIAMELVRGETLRAALDRGAIDLRKALEYLTQVAEGLTAAHGAGLVHRDLKPENLMIAEGGYAKILDFGLAKLRDESALVSPEANHTTIAVATSPGVVLGTVGYMSPEQAQGRTVDHRSDVFSFGCVLYEAATGKRPFAGASTVDTLHRIIHDEPAPLAAAAPAAPSDLTRIARKCLAKDPDERYQSMKEVAIDLRDLRRQLESGPIAGSGAIGPAERGRGGSRWIVAIAIVILALIAGAAWWYWPRPAGAPAGPLKIERFTSSGNVIDAVISPDGKYVAYVESAGGSQSLWIRQIPGTRPLQLVAPATVGYWGVKFAHDSASIYYALKGPPPEDSAGTLYRIPILGGTPRRILRGIDSNITLSPVGRQLAYFRAAYPDATSSALLIADADGANGRVLATRKSPEFFAPGFFVAPAWSPDGARIVAAVRNAATRDGGLVDIEVAAGRERAFPSRFAFATFTHWLPDGSGVLFVAMETSDFYAGAGGQLWLQPYPDGAARRITSDLAEYRNVSVSADGQSLVTVGTDVTTALWVLSLDGRTPPRRLPSTKYDGLLGLGWMRDGRLIYTSLEGGTPQIWRSNADGTDRRQLTTDGANAWPVCSPDGRFIVFGSSRSGEPAFWRMDPDGSDQRPIARAPDLRQPAFTPDGRSIVFTSANEGVQTLWKLAIDGGQPVLVSRQFARASVSPDGRRLAGLYRPTPTSPPTFVGIAPVDGGPVQQTFPAVFPSAGPVVAWTADGKGILYGTTERTSIWLQPLAGGKPARVTSFDEGVIFQIDVSPDGKKLLISRGQQPRDAFLITNFK